MADKVNTPEEKYMYDANYRMLVDMIENLIHQSQFTPSEIREASTFACIRYEMRRPMPIMFIKEKK
jgi:hypothetical protein